MKHTQILDKLAIEPIPAVVHDEVNGLAGKSFIRAKHEGVHGARSTDVVPPLMHRSSGLLDRTDDEADRMIGHQVAIALATSLHQVGLADTALTARAVDGSKPTAIASTDGRRSSISTSSPWTRR